MALHYKNMFIFVLTTQLRSDIIKKQWQQQRSLTNQGCLLRVNLESLQYSYFSECLWLIEMIEMQCLNDILLVLFAFEFFKILLNVAL